MIQIIFLFTYNYYNIIFNSNCQGYCYFLLNIGLKDTLLTLASYFANITLDLS